MAHVLLPTCNLQQLAASGMSDVPWLLHNVLALLLPVSPSQYYTLLGLATQQPLNVQSEQPNGVEKLLKHLAPVNKNGGSGQNSSPPS